MSDQVEFDNGALHLISFNLFYSILFLCWPLSDFHIRKISMETENYSQIIRPR